MGQKERLERAVKKYLEGGVTLRELERKYEVSASTIHRWARKQEADWARAVKDGSAGGRQREPELPVEVRRLRKELEESRLYAKLLNAMIDIAEEQFEIPIRKKRGARQS